MPADLNCIPAAASAMNSSRLVPRGELEHEQGGFHGPLRPSRSLSVRTSLDPAGFPAYLHSYNNPLTVFNQRRLPQHHPRQSHFRPYHPHRTMPMAQPQCDSFVSPVDHGRTSVNPLSPTTNFDHGISMPSTFAHDHDFENFLNLSGDESTFTDTVATSYWPDVGMSYHGSFRPAESYNSSIGGGVNSTSNVINLMPVDNDNMMSKVDTTLTTPTPAFLPHHILPHQVNIARYENIDDDTWALSSVEYDPESPGSLDSQSNGPDTPASTTFGSSFSASFSGSSATSNGSVGEVESLNLNGFRNPHAHGICARSVSGTCQCFAPSNPSIEPASLSMISNAAQPHHEQTAVFDNHHPHIHGQPVGPYHDRMIEEITASYPTNKLTATTSFRNSVQSEMETSPEPENTSDEASRDDSDIESDMSDEEVTKPSAALSSRRDRDTYLLKARKKGWSYKDIKRRGGFREAESTLRGRVRVLTKDKSERVRKPEWTAGDLHLLHRAVERFDGEAYSGGERESHGRIPWKKISLWMHKAGSSYLFAPATCAKKWREIS